MLKVSASTLRYLPIIVKVLLSGQRQVEAATVSETWTSEIWVTEGGTCLPNTEHRSVNLYIKSFY